jgi:hypothetical protein
VAHFILTEMGRGISMKSAGWKSKSTALLIACVAATACSSREAEMPTDDALVSGPRVESVSRVVVALDPAVPADRAERYANEGGQHWIEQAITDALSAAGRLDPNSDVELAVKVVGFRLRSTAATVWVGSMAGNDSVDLEVEARRGDQVVKSFRLQRSSIQGGLIMPAAGTRLRRICAALADDILRRL